MRRYIAYSLLVIALFTLIIWTISRYIQPILPSNINTGTVLFFAILTSVIGLIAGFKDVLELVTLLTKKDYGQDHPVPAQNQKLTSPPEKIFQNLPQRDYNTFIGRQTERATIRQLLHRDSRHFVVTIDGIGGVGKSTLAIETAHFYLEYFSRLAVEERFEAIIWASAKQTTLTGEGIRERSQALHTLDDIYTYIAVTLDRKDITRAPADLQHSLVRQALIQQRTLLIIDNLETIDDERINTFIQEVPAPTKVLVTTRHRMDIAYPLRLKGMEKEDAVDLAKGECIQKGVNLSFSEIDQLYERTGGVPLAIVWSIAQMGLGYSSDSVLSRLGQPTSDIAQFCFGGVTERIKTKPSYKLLMALTLFATDASRNALGDIAHLSELDQDEGLVELERLSLVNKNGNRFQMLPLTRIYAKSELDKDRNFKDNIRQRWIDYLQRFLTQRGQMYEHINEISIETRNILEAIDWCLTTSKLVEFITFLGKMNFYLWATGNWSIWNRYLAQAPQIAASLGLELEQANFLAWLASMRYYQDRLSEAEDFIKKAISIYQLHNINGELALSLRRFASIQIKRGQAEEARINLEQALLLAREVGNKRYISRVQRQLAKLDINDGNLNEALSRLIEAKQLREQETPQSSGLAYIYRLLGQIYLKKKDLQMSRQHYSRSLDIGYLIMSQHDIAEAKLGLAELDFILGNKTKAAALAGEAIEGFRKLGMRGEIRSAESLLQQISTKKRI